MRLAGPAQAGEDNNQEPGDSPVQLPQRHALSPFIVSAARGQPRGAQRHPESVRASAGVDPEGMKAAPGAESAASTHAARQPGSGMRGTGPLVAPNRLDLWTHENTSSSRACGRYRVGWCGEATGGYWGARSLCITCLPGGGEPVSVIRLGMGGAANYISFPQTARHWAVASSLRWAATWTACGKRPRPGADRRAWGDHSSSLSRWQRPPSQ